MSTDSDLAGLPRNWRYRVCTNPECGHEGWDHDNGETGGSSECGKCPCEAFTLEAE